MVPLIHHLDEQTKEIVKQALRILRGDEVIIIPEGATNGDMINAMFPNIEIEQIEDIIDVYGMSKCRVTYDTDWWNKPYKSESEEV